MRNLFGRAQASGAHPKKDAGSGSFDQYAYDLVPKKSRVTMRLAGSDPCQAELDRVLRLGSPGGGDVLQAFLSKRSIEDERLDAPMPARFLADGRMSDVVGVVPRGLEPIVIEALARLEKAGASTRIPARIVKTRNGLRVDLLLGKTR